MSRVHICLVVAVAIAIAIVPVSAEDQSSGAASQQAEAEEKAEADQKAEAAKKAEAPKGEPEKRAKADKGPPSYEGTFLTAVLAGSARNDFQVPQPSIHLRDIQATLNWLDTEYAADTRICPQAKGSQPIVIQKTVDPDDANKSIVSIMIPSPRCWWPLNQLAQMTITAKVEGAGELPQSLFDGNVPVSVEWFPMLVTLLTVAIIYPGSAMAAYFLHQRRFKQDTREHAERKRTTPPAPPPSFLSLLDPIQITANQFGRASISKLQIYVFSILVFALLLYYQLRFGVLAAMSVDVMELLGISAVGAAGGKLTHVAKRRLKLENYAILRQLGWLSEEKDNVARRAQWSELFIDSSTKEFDPYAFQMAIFSLVVAVALVRTNLSGLASFTIPQGLLGLLGISQAVFIGGQAITKSGHAELDDKLDAVRDSEAKYFTTEAEEKAKGTTGDALKAKLEPDLKAFQTSLADAAEMFWSVYSELLVDRPKALDIVSQVQPGGRKPPAAH